MLAGLSCAPQYVTKKHGSLDGDCIVASNIDSVILPADACGGDGALAFARSMTNNKVHHKNLLVLLCTHVLKAYESILS